MKVTRKLASIIAVSGAVALVLSGCAAGNGNTGTDGGETSQETKATDHNPQSRENLKEGGEVRFAINEITPQMNIGNSDASADTVRLAAWYTPQVLLIDPDGTVKPNPAYLDSWEIETKDGKTVITGKVNDKATWNDGTVIDWTAFETTWKAYNGTDEAYKVNSTDNYKDIESVEKGETDKDVVITFKKEFAWPEAVFSTLLHPAVNTAEIFNTGFLESPHPEWGAGPYKLTDYDVKGQTATFEPNEMWWGDAPLLDEVTFRGLDETAAINAFKNDEIDMVETPNKDFLAQVAGMEDVVTYRAQRTSKTVLIVDSDKPQFEDIAVREAFFLGTDIDQLKQVIWNGLDYEEEPAGSLNMYDFQEGYSDSYAEAGLEHDAEKAKELLDEAGWAEGEDGIREKDGTKLSVVFPTHNDSPTTLAMLQALQQQQKEIGFDVKIEQRASADFSTDFTTKNWDAFMLQFTDGDPFGPAYFCQLYCSDSSLNLSGTSTEEIDAQIKDEVESQTTAEAWTEASMKLEPEIIKETWGVIPLYNGPWIVTAKEGLANLTPEPYVGLDGFGVTPVENVGWEK
ncbi:MULTISPECIES: ABC transporter family substrate-binding protein [unclassified Microbacterium]|uniref:ABC transporter family substrate-binding protein n=1 Tax=unclassified Microbacterium TaxID=2609290 RepID=UPI000EA882ED|nr:MULTISPECIES: ABC transporter family substrate-binding protein [unclassified Microbacterium]MBT2486162.1 ABC transporter family substrate-binding protein [Microbacterium sp. ISL-108]RKN68888.1 ABC transporter family substrate-binding protein [Microbacterium sp. CGR2]